MAINSKKKGNAGENRWANWLQEQGIKAFRNSSSGSNAIKSDTINGMDANFEVKTVKKINLREAWRQSCRDADMTHCTPYLVIHLDGMPENEWLMVMRNWDWLELIKEDKKVEATYDPNEREKRWALENLKNAITRALKHL